MSNKRNAIILNFLSDNNNNNDEYDNINNNDEDIVLTPTLNKKRKVKASTKKTIKVTPNKSPKFKTGSIKSITKSSFGLNFSDIKKNIKKNSANKKGIKKGLIK